MSALIDFIAEHKTAIGITVTHAAHLVWPNLKAAYPYAKENGGVRGIIKNFLFGKPQAETKTP